MKLVLETAKEVQDYCEKNGWAFCFIGGIALQRWGIPRNTLDVDLTLLTGIGPEEEVTRKILESFKSRIDENPLGFFLPRRIVLVSRNNVGIDISLGATGFEESSIERSSYFEFIKGIKLRTCSAEDLIVHKAFANRLKDWADIENVISVQEILDWGYIYENLKPLAELLYAPEILTDLEKIRIRFSNR